MSLDLFLSVDKSIVVLFITNSQRFSFLGILKKNLMQQNQENKMDVG